ETADVVMMRLFTSTSRKSGARSAETKFAKVGFSGTKCGVNVRISFGGLNAVLIIQYAGNAITIVKSTPTALATTEPARLWRTPATESRANVLRRGAGRRTSMLVISRCLRS